MKFRQKIEKIMTKNGEFCVKMLLTMETATHKNATRFAPPLSRRALATSKSSAIDNILYFYASKEIKLDPIP